MRALLVAAALAACASAPASAVETYTDAFNAYLDNTRWLNDAEIAYRDNTITHDEYEQTNRLAGQANSDIHDAVDDKHNEHETGKNN